MRGPLRDHLFVRATGPRRPATTMPFRPATKLTTQMIVMTCFFEEGGENSQGEGDEGGPGKRRLRPLAFNINMLSAAKCTLWIRRMGHSK